MNLLNPVLQEWINRSDQDFRAATDLYRLDAAGYRETVMFHLQQCVEKLLKPVLVKHGKAFPKTHALEDLANAVNVYLPDWLPDLEALDSLSDLGIGARYPGYDLSLDELDWAFSLCVSVREALLPVVSRDAA